MTNVIEFIQKVKAKGVEPPKAFTCSLNRALLTVQYCVLVLHDIETARGIMQVLTVGGELGERVELPGMFRKIVENTDTAATYRVALGVDDEQG